MSFPSKPKSASVRENKSQSGGSIVLPSAAIDFSRLITPAASRFAGRGWVLDEIARWLRSPSPGSRYFLITGAPGSGKTYLSSRIAALSAATEENTGAGELSAGFLSAVHFCSSREALWINPFAFCRSISEQLARRYQEYASAMVKSAAGDIHIDIKQTVGEGEAIGIETLEIHAGPSSPEDVFWQICRVPLEALCAARPSKQFLILVDGVDEALGYHGPVGIAALLANLDTLSENVRFILTSRENTQIETTFGGADISLSDFSRLQDNKADLSAYLELELPEAEKPDESLGELKREIIEQGNFLVAYLSVRMVQTIGYPDAAKGLPFGLPALMTDWISRLLKLTGRDWVEDYSSILGSLSVARESLSEAQLRTITGQSAVRLRTNISNLREFLRTQSDDSKTEPMTYSLYHQSLADFLFTDSINLKTSTIPNRFFLSKTDQHERLALRLRGDSPSWNRLPWQTLDGYAYRHLSSHLANLAKLPAYSNAIYDFVSIELYNHKRNDFENLSSFVDDVHEAIAVARDRSCPNVTEWIRCTLILACIQEAVDLLPSIAVAALAFSGQLVRAISIAKLRSDFYDGAWIAEAAFAQGNIPTAREYADRAAALARTQPGGKRFTVILEMLRTLGEETKLRNFLRETLSRERMMGVIFPNVFEELADFCARVGDMTEVIAAVDEIPNDPTFRGAGQQDFLWFVMKKTQALHTAQIAEAWLGAGNDKRALEAVDRSLAIEKETGRPIDEVRLKNALVLLKLGRKLRGARLIERLGANSQADFRKLRQATFGRLEPLFEHARRANDEEGFQFAVAEALKRREIDFAISETERWNVDFGRKKAFEKIAVAAAQIGRWDCVARALMGTGIVLDDELWRSIARALDNLPTQDVEGTLAKLQFVARTLLHKACAAEVLAICAYGLARHGAPRAAVGHVEELIAEANARAGKATFRRTLAEIALCFMDNGGREAEELAQALMCLPGFAEADSGFAVGNTPEQTLEAFRIWREENATKDEEISDLIAKRGLGRLGEKLDEIDADLAQFRENAPDEKGTSTIKNPVETAKTYPTPESFAKELAAATSPISKYSILESSGADVTMSFGPWVVLDSAFEIAPLLRWTDHAISKIVSTLAGRGNVDLSLILLAGHLDRPGALLGRSSYFSELNEYIPILREFENGALLKRISETIMEFGFGI
jgi:hypothetical protein